MAATSSSRRKGRRKRRPAGQAPVVPVPVPAGDHHVGAREPTAKAGRTWCRPSLPPRVERFLRPHFTGSWFMGRQCHAQKQQQQQQLLLLCWYYSLMMPEDLTKEKKVTFRNCEMSSHSSMEIVDMKRNKKCMSTHI